jgi:L-lactate dehydrogenase complex protein LldG
MSGRDQVLAKVRSALRTAERAAAPEENAPPPAPARRARPATDPAELLERFAERVQDYRATVVRTTEDGVGEVVALALRDVDPGAVAVPVGLPRAWVPAGAVDGSALSTAELPGIAAVVTGCRVAIAETGTIVLDHAEDQGPRRLTLVPDRHVCVVRAGQIVDDVDDGFLALRPAPPSAGRGAAPLTFVSGPSATSDIELQRVEGVHGPRTLVVVLVEDGSSG